MRTKYKRIELLTILVLSIVVFIMNVNPLMVNAAVYKLSSGIEKYKVDYLTRNYSVQESQHFIYRFTVEDKVIIDLIMQDSEKSYSELTKVFEYIPKKKITVIVFSSIDVMNMAIGLPQEVRAMGLYSCGFISILSPNEWIAKKNSEQFKETFKKSGPMLHELAHYFIDIKSKGNYPAWFTEGVALYFENAINGTEWGKGVNYEMRPYTLEELTNNFGNLKQDYAYRRSLEIVSSYVDKYGIDMLIESIDRLGRGYPIQDFGN